VRGQPTYRLRVISIAHPLAPSPAVDAVRRCQSAQPSLVLLGQRTAAAGPTRAGSICGSLG